MSSQSELLLQSRKSPSDHAHSREFAFALVTAIVLALASGTRSTGWRLEPAMATRSVSTTSAPSKLSWVVQREKCTWTSPRPGVRRKRQAFTLSAGGDFSVHQASSRAPGVRPSFSPQNHRLVADTPTYYPRFTTPDRQSRHRAGRFERIRRANTRLTAGGKRV
jgi:hypothetical protein